MPSDWRVPGFTSTASLRPEALFGPAEPGTGGPPPERVTRAAGCRVWDEAGREYVDYVMALGAVALGYGHPAVNRAAEQAIAAGVVGPLPPPVVVELVVVEEPRREWLAVLREETARVGAVLVFDEIKTAFRLAVGGAGERYGVQPDLVVLGKALANGFPLAAVGGRQDLMAGVARTWISSTLATEGVALAAARATLAVVVSEAVPAHLHRVGTRLLPGLHRLQREHAAAVAGVGGVAEMCFLHYASDGVSRAVARGCAARGVLFKRTAYNFVSLAHDEATVDRTLDVLDDVLRSAAHQL